MKFEEFITKALKAVEGEKKSAETKQAKNTQDAKKNPPFDWLKNWENKEEERNERLRKFQESGKTKK